jgi:hypothetical protein
MGGDWLSLMEALECEMPTEIAYLEATKGRLKVVRRQDGAVIFRMRRSRSRTFTSACTDSLAPIDVAQGSKDVELHGNETPAANSLTL